MKLRIRAATSADAPRLEEVRREAFAPVFESFRALLGDELFNLSDAPKDAEQARYLSSLLAPESDWDVYVAETNDVVVGFVSIQLGRDTAVGEIGLNAVDPRRSGAGIGTMMYNFAVEQMKQAGMRVAKVGTGADSSHEPARRAYLKAGFDVGVPSVWLYRKL